MTDEKAFQEQADRYVQALREARARKPGHSVLFPDLGNARLRRQIVRWLGRTYASPTEGALETLRSALDDADWEVRVSAMLVAARMRAAQLRSAVGRVDLPSAHTHGLDERDAHLLVAARLIATTSLDCADAEDRESALTRALPDAPSHLVRSVLGAPVDQRDDAWLLLYSLATPSELEDPLPDPLPPGLTTIDRRIWLGGEIEMVWVSPTLHLLGGGSNANDTASPIRAHAPDRGFFLSRTPISRARATAFGFGGTDRLAHAGAEMRARLAATPDPPFLATLEDAHVLCEALSRQSNAHVSLPSADELECGARGTDGRRYSWGNGAERLDGAERSPHGVERFAVPAGQWTSTVNARLEPVAMGGPASPRCSVRYAATGPQSVRIIVRT